MLTFRQFIESADSRDLDKLRMLISDAQDSGDSEKLENYFMSFRNKRWPEAEALILLDPYVAFLYAAYVINGRWPELENSIKTKDFDLGNLDRGDLEMYIVDTFFNGYSNFEQVLEDATVKGFFSKPYCNEIDDGIYGVDLKKLSKALIDVIENPTDPELLKILFMESPNSLKNLLLKYHTK